MRAHGVRGDVKLQSETDASDRFLGLKTAFLKRGGAVSPITVRNVRLLTDGCVLHIDGFDTMDAAETLRGAEVCVDRDHAVILPEKTYFITELIGCEVTDTSGKSYGKITDVLRTPANDVYEIDNGRLMVPALKKLIVSADMAACQMVFDADVLSEVGLFAD